MDQMDWNQLKAFLETAETGTLSAAARKLGLTQPTLSRQVAAIEKHLGVTLFERVGKSMALTATGLDLLAHARTMGYAAEALGLAASSQSQAVTGVVSVSASDMFASHLLPRLVKQLRTHAPGITLEVISSDAISDLQRREADIAIRLVNPEQPDLIARRVGSATAYFYASQEWVNTHGIPRTAQDAAHLPFVGSDRAGRYLAYLRQHGLSVSESNFSCYANDTDTHWQLVRQGLGIGAMMLEIAQTATGMVRVLDLVPPVQFPVWLVTHRELRTSRRIRLVFDHLAEHLTHMFGSHPD